MHIIFGKQQADELGQKYTVLELDTFQMGIDGTLITAYCAVENIPLEELSRLPETKTQHEHLLINYRGQAWNDCLIGIQQLTGKWQGELDSFYQDLASRVELFIANPPGAGWSPVILKAAS
jgi:hypothetical protein